MLDFYLRKRRTIEQFKICKVKLFIMKERSVQVQDKVLS